LKSNKELGITKIPSAYAKTIIDLALNGIVDISKLDKPGRIALGVIGKQTGAFRAKKVSILEQTQPFKVLDKNHKYIRIQKITVSEENATTVT
jgi:hypothetical protein